MTAQQLRWLLVVASLLLLAGFISPIMTITQLVWINHSFSIMSGIWQLWQEGHIILFLLVAAFSIILPIAKIILLFNLLHPKTTQVFHRKKLLQLMHNYGRWAMLDVMVVAILIVSVKLGAIASIQIHAGLYVFGGAVLLLMLITHYVVKLYQDH
ncbi:MAG: paraquat-inducible protein A [Methylophagaceae bacterium]|jgi:paraquat-inducible protein A